MSTRRSTRASSHAGSSRAQSPNPFSDMGTPRRNPRRLTSKAPLPAVPVQQSTAYGTKSPVKPAGALSQDGHDEDLDVILEGITRQQQDTIETSGNPGRASRQGSVETEASNTSQDTPTSFASRHRSRDAYSSFVRARGAGNSRTRTNKVITSDEASVSFQHESGIYGDATIMEGDETAVSETDWPGLGGIQPGVQGFEHIANQTQRPENQSYIEKASQIYHSTSGFVKSTIIDSSKTVHSMFDQSVIFIKQAPQLFIMAILFIMTVALVFMSPVIQETPTGRSIGSYCLEVKHYLGRHVPKLIAHPLNYFTEKDIFDLQSRMSNVEYDLAQLKKNSNLNQVSINKLEELVPNFVVCKTDRNGAVQIPRDFWLALKDRIQDDTSLSKKTSGQDPTTKDVQDIATSIWSNFIRQNNVQIKTLYTDVFDDLWARRLKDALKDNVVVSKSDFIEAIQKNWEDSQSLVKAQVSQLAADVEQSIKTSKQRTAGLTQEQAKSISETVFRQLVPRAQLEALANAKIQHSIDYSLLRFNHFSPGGGAVINPTLISPTYQLPTRPGFLARLFLDLRYPNPAVEALTKWDEAGECWCAPSKGTHSGIQLGVLIANDIYPDEVVVEHVPKTATLDPGSTPRQMELFAQIRGDALGAIVELSSRLFPDAPVEIDLGETWVRLAIWEYDLDGARAQAFPVAIDLKALRVSVKQLVVRARTNWGEVEGEKGTDHTCLYRVRVHGEVAN